MASFAFDTNNELFQLATELVNQTGRNLFLTGKAGTGKTTFLKYIRENCPKQMAIVAPTGVAAINAGGVTIHSFFQIAPGLFLPTLQRTGFSELNPEVQNRHSLVARLRFNNDKRKVLRQLELLIIDEVSMVRCDLLDAIDTVLRFVRKRPLERFGGVQVLFIGDLYQLPPVNKEADWVKLSEYYSSPFFFDSVVLKDELPLYIEFEKIYRQSEENFIRLLNQVRNNELDEEGRRILESRYEPRFHRKKDDGFIVLTTHNEQARNINTAQLNQLEAPPRQYDAIIERDFPENAYPADEKLNLKTGAQVMFIKNDISERGKRYFNGKIGTIARLEDEKLFVQCDDEPEIEVEREKWKNIRYSINKNNQQLEEDVLGSFSQFPVRLAWAITIHKSQGLTFEKAIIDAGEAFAPGQVYVALSRCTSLDGMVLKSRLRNSSLLTDQRIISFSRNIASSASLQQELESAKKQYLEKQLISVFDFSNAVNSCQGLRGYLLENQSSFNPETLPWLEKIAEQVNGLQDTGLKFHTWLKEQFAQPIPPQENTLLKERTKKAAEHFVKEMLAIIAGLGGSPAITDSRQHAKEYNDSLKELFAQLSLTRHVLEGFDGKFDIAAWQQQRKDFVLPAFYSNAYAGASQKTTIGPHPALYKQLKELRDSICERKNLPVYLVVGGSTLDEMARYLPQSLTELRQISGFGDTKLEQYGQQFLDIILEYSVERGLDSLVHQKQSKRDRKQGSATKRKKGDTYTESFRLFKEGKTISEIAAERSYAVSTIEGHLLRFIRSGELDVTSLLSKEKIAMIEKALKELDGSLATSPIKERLGDAVSFGEIRWVVASLNPEPNDLPDQ